MIHPNNSKQILASSREVLSVNKPLSSSSTTYGDSFNFSKTPFALVQYLLITTNKCKNKMQLKQNKIAAFKNTLNDKKRILSKIGTSRYTK